MKIAIDAFRVVCEPQTSGAVYVTELASALAGHSSVEVVYLVVPDRHAPLSGLPGFSSPKVKWLVSPATYDPSSAFLRQLWWVQRTYPRTVSEQAGNVDWLIAPYHQTPMFLPRGWRVLTVIHDLCGLRADCGYRTVGRGYWHHMTNFVTAVVGTDAIVAISEYTRSQMLKRFPSLGARPTRVAYNAVTAKRLTANAATEAVSALNLPDAFFLAYAAAGPRKGTDLTLKAYAEYRRRGGVAALALIGGRAGTAEWRQVADSLNVERVIWLSGVSDLVRDAMYAKAIALVFPSRCEGFGYPLVEAMRQGCPVISDSDSPAAEIVGDSQPLMTGLNIEAITMQMRQFESLGGGERIDLSNRLEAESNKYSGDQLAQQFISLMLSDQPMAVGRPAQ